jgi:hypothetical protein
MSELLEAVLHELSLAQPAKAHAAERAHMAKVRFMIIPSKVFSPAVQWRQARLFASCRGRWTTNN